MSRKAYRCTLSEDSIKGVIFELKAYQMSIEPKVQRALQRIQTEASDVLREKLHVSGRWDESNGESGSHVEIEPEKNGFVIYGCGTQIGFLEFGAGARVDTQHEFADDAPFGVYPGSYSDTIGAGTWGDWIKAGKDPDKYPYNRVPLRPLYETSVWIRDNWLRIFKEEWAK